MPLPPIFRSLEILFSGNNRPLRLLNAPWDLWPSSSTFSDKFKARYPPNIVRNQKYNLASFFPIVLYEQFKFFFNLYFLLVALSQFVPQLRIGAYLGYGARALGPN